MEEYLMLLDSDDPARRLEGLTRLGEMVSDASIDKKVVIEKLKEMILDWDEDVRTKVSEVLKVYVGK